MHSPHIASTPALERRTFLKGLGTAVALPFLDAMVPAGSALAKTAATPVKRLGFVFMPMGADISRWTPEGSGRADAARNLYRSSLRRFGRLPHRSGGTLAPWFRHGLAEIFSTFVADEERHYEQYDRQVDNIARFGKSYLALQSFGPGEGDGEAGPA